MIGPRMDDMAAAHIAELRRQAARPRPARRVARPGRDGASRTVRTRVKSRLGSYLIETGQRLVTPSTPHSPPA